ncbi:MAG TPA: CbiX/SirB N-terminal domain-containing protein, partial [Phototrophicaceae bacterium]|nr:CbiX/SirB N-terminal domain-containing protein [Phototrophicaceae bacterium]
MPRTALILAGHGSHISPNTAGVVWEQVDRLRTLNVADEVTAAFWKETPSFHQAINTLDADDITIVPLFTAQ